MSIPSSEIETGVLIKELPTLIAGGMNLLAQNDEVAVYHYSTSNGIEKTYRVPMDQIINRIGIKLDQQGRLITAFGVSPSSRIKPLTSIGSSAVFNQGFILPIQLGGTGSSTEKYLKNTTDTLNGILTVFDEQSSSSSSLGKDLSTHNISCDSFTSENNSYINANFYVKNSTSTHGSDIEVYYGEQGDPRAGELYNGITLSALAEDRRGIWDHGTRSWLLYSLGQGSTAKHVFNGTASCARTLSSPNGEVYIYNYNNNQTRYRVVFTGYGNLRVDKSTDSGQTWEIDHYAAHVPNVSTTALRKTYFGDNMNGKNDNPTASYFLCINKDWKNGGFITIDEAKSFLKVPTFVQDAKSGDGVTLNNNTAQIVQTITLTPGRYIISYGCSFGTNTSGVRICQLRTQSTNTFSWSRRAAVSTAGAGNGTPLQRTAHVTVTQNTTYRLWAKQTSGTTLGCYPYIDYTKITV